jgi:hypothetical protein
VDIPLACTLEPTAARARVEEWQDVISLAVARSERVALDRLELVLHADLADCRALMLLAQREMACCRFFRFAFDVEADTVRLVVGVPEDAVAVLDDFALLTHPA